jgi:competence protein ComEA
MFGVVERVRRGEGRGGSGMESVAANWVAIGQQHQEELIMKTELDCNGKGSIRGVSRLGSRMFVAISALLLTVSAFAMVTPAMASVPVDLNRAGLEELATLPGIGESKAAAILAERKKSPFASVDDLTRVKGIGDATVQDLRAKVSVGSKKN